MGSGNNRAHINMSKFTGNIRILRQLRNFSQEYMASQLGMSQTNFARIEKGQVSVTANILDQIAEVLGYSTEVLICFDPDKISGFPTGQACKPVDVKSENELENRLNKVESHLIGLYSLVVNLSQQLSCKCNTTSS